VYWIYLAIFVAMIFVPDMVRDDFWGFERKTLEELAIFFFGGLGFIFYLIRERQLQKAENDKAKAQRDSNRMSRDLTHSYSFIGEINRKLEIFKNISLGLPSWSDMTLSKKNEMFEYMMDAIRILTKTDEYALIFMDKKTTEQILVIKSKKHLKLEFNENGYLENEKKYFENDGYITIISPEDMQGIISILMVKKKNPAFKIEDPDIFKAIVSQALFLYVYSERRRKKR